MTVVCKPFQGDDEPLFSRAEFLMALAIQSADRHRRISRLHSNVCIGLRKLGGAVDLGRMMSGITWIEFAARATPRRFNPVFLALLSEGLIDRSELTDDVFGSLARLLVVGDGADPESQDAASYSEDMSAQLRRTAYVVEETGERELTLLLAPISEFVPRLRRGYLGGGSAGDFKSFESEATGLTVRSVFDPAVGVTVFLQDYNDSRHPIPNCSVSIVGADGAQRAGPVRCDRGEARFHLMRLRSGDSIAVVGGADG